MTPVPEKTAAVELSLVLPAYNEGSGIAQAVGRAVRELETLTPHFEIIVVNDGSRDDTRAVLDALTPKIQQLQPIHLRRNVGQHIATVIGLRRATGAYVVTADADEQVPFDNISTLLETAYADPSLDVVNGVRSTRNAHATRDLGSRAVTWILNRSMGVRLSDPATTFRLFRRAALEEILEADWLSQNIPILVAHLGLRIGEVDVQSSGRAARNSSYSLSKLVHILLLALLNFSTGVKTILSLMAIGLLSFVGGSTGLVGLVLYGMIEATRLPTNLLLFFVLLMIIGLQFLLVGAVAYKVERLNANLRFRRQIAHVDHDRAD